MHILSGPLGALLSGVVLMAYQVVVLAMFYFTMIFSRLLLLLIAWCTVVFCLVIALCLYRLLWCRHLLSFCRIIPSCSLFFVFSVVELANYLLVIPLLILGEGASTLP